MKLVLFLRAKTILVLRGCLGCSPNGAILLQIAAFRARLGVGSQTPPTIPKVPLIFAVSEQLAKKQLRALLIHQPRMCLKQTAGEIIGPVGLCKAPEPIKRRGVLGRCAARPDRAIPAQRTIRGVVCIRNETFGKKHQAL